MAAAPAPSLQRGAGGYQSLHPAMASADPLTALWVCLGVLALLLYLAVYYRKRYACARREAPGCVACCEASGCGQCLAFPGCDCSAAKPAPTLAILYHDDGDALDGAAARFAQLLVREAGAPGSPLRHWTAWAEHVEAHKKAAGGAPLSEAGEAHARKVEAADCVMFLIAPMPEDGHSPTERVLSLYTLHEGARPMGANDVWAE